MRFTLTGGQKGDAPQAAALNEGLPAEVVMRDTAYDADHLRQAIAAKGALAVIPNNPARVSRSNEWLPVDQVYGRTPVVRAGTADLPPKKWTGLGGFELHLAREIYPMAEWSRVRF